MSDGRAPTRIVSQGDSAPPYHVAASEGFAAWLHANDMALAVTTYQIGKLFLVGAVSPDRLSVTERTFERCLGLAVGDNTLTLAGLNAIYRFQNVVPAGGNLEGHDAVYVPRTAWFTGDVFAHDVGLTPSGRPIFVNTLFSCVATVDETSSFRPIWQPNFIPALTPEDRCHLNGLAMEDGVPKYVTAAGHEAGAGSWRSNRVGGGCLMDFASKGIVAGGLTMPHSPRLADGRLFLCSAGTGEIGEIDLATGQFQPIAFCPGFLRGLALHANVALVGLSLPRRHAAFAGLPLEDRLRQDNKAPDCAVQIIDLTSGQLLHWLRLGGVVQELYDIALIPGPRSPMLVGFAQGQINRLISRGPDMAPEALLAQPR